MVETNRDENLRAETNRTLLGFKRIRESTFLEGQIYWRIKIFGGFQSFGDHNFLGSIFAESNFSGGQKFWVAIFSWANFFWGQNC